PPIIAVPLLHTVEPSPDSINRMLQVRTKMSKFPGKHGGTPGGVDDPARTNDTFDCVWRDVLVGVRSFRRRRAAPSIDVNHLDHLPARAIQFAICYLRGTPEVAPCTHGEI